MSSLQLQFAAKSLQEDPVELIKIIIQNNPEAVSQRLQNYYGVSVAKSHWQGLFDETLNQVNLNPDNAELVLQQILSVDIIPENLTQLGQDLVLNQLIEIDGVTVNTEKYSGNYGIQKSAGGPFTDWEDIYSGTEVTGTYDATNNVNGGEETSTNFNWGAIIQNVAGSIVNQLFPANNNNNTPPAPNKPAAADNTWIWIVVIVILVLVAAFIILRNKN